MYIHRFSGKCNKISLSLTTGQVVLYNTYLEPCRLQRHFLFQHDILPVERSATGDWRQRSLFLDKFLFPSSGFSIKSPKILPHVGFVTYSLEGTDGYSRVHTNFPGFSKSKHFPAEKGFL